MPGAPGKPPDADLFVNELARRTGLNRNVIRAWVLAEGAYDKGGTGHYNFLNVGAKPGGAGYSGVKLAGTSPGGFAWFGSLADAVEESAYWINSMSNYAGIRAAVGKEPGVQLAAIAQSRWDAGHYTKGGKRGQGLLDAYKSVTKSGWHWPAWNEGLLDAVGVHVPNPVKAVTNPIAGAIGKGVDALLEGLLEVVVAGAILALAAALAYNGVRRLSGDRLPSGTDLTKLAATRGAAA